jgi:hypothetical protein
VIDSSPATGKREWCADEEGVAAGVKIHGW